MNSAIEQLRAAFRAEVVCTQTFADGSKCRYCTYCDSDWNVGADEAHAPWCLAAPTLLTADMPAIVREMTQEQVARFRELLMREPGGALVPLPNPMPPRDPTDAMCAASPVTRFGGRWEPDVMRRIWIAMYDEWLRSRYAATPTLPPSPLPASDM